MTQFPLKVIQSEYSMNEDGINPLTGLYSLELKKKKSNLILPLSASDFICV